MDEPEFDRIYWHMPPTSSADTDCKKYLAIVFGCMMPKNHLRSFYAHGTGADCSRERANLYSCMHLKIAKRDTKEKIFAANRDYVRKQEGLAPGHFWKERVGAPASWPEQATVGKNA
jgi:hypothetical protein